MTIKVCVFKPAGRRHYQAQWSDPVTGKKKTKSTGCEKRRDAERFAGDLQKQLTEGTFKNAILVTWEAFREKYESDVVPTLRPKTRKKVSVSLNAVETYINPKRLASVDAEQLAALQRKMRDRGRSPSSIKSVLAHIKAALRWAHRAKLLRDVPQIEMPTAATKAKRRAVTGEEFDRIIDAVSKITGASQAESWKRLLTGLYWSGLRLSEAMRLTWGEPDTFAVKLDGRRPLFSIPGALQKSGKTELVPMAPEFAEFLFSVPAAERTGFVFTPEPIRSKHAGRLGEQQVGKVLGWIGTEAKVRTGTKDGQCATAHDLRRAFGVRWSKRVMPAVLCKLMRHASVQTTMEFYNVEDAEQTADSIWESFANTSANTEAKNEKTAEIPEQMGSSEIPTV